MTQVLLGLGTNVQRDENLCAGLDALQALFGPLDCSPVFESEPVGIRSQCFLNMVVRINTELPLPELLMQLKAIEAAQGRFTAAPRQLPLDIDVLTYGEQVGELAGYQLPRPGIESSAHILWPLALLVPQQSLPGSANNFVDLWARAKVTHDLWPYKLQWQGQQLTPEQLLTVRQSTKPAKAAML